MLQQLTLTQCDRANVQHMVSELLAPCHSLPDVRTAQSSVSRHHLLCAPFKELRHLKQSASRSASEVDGLMLCAQCKKASVNGRIPLSRAAEAVASLQSFGERLHQTPLLCSQQ